MGLLAFAGQWNIKVRANAPGPRSICSAIIALLVFANLTFVGDAQAQIYKVLKDWNVHCSAVLECSMTHYPEDDKNLIYTFTLKRGTTANAPVFVLMSLKGDLDSETAIHLKVEGREEEFVLPAQADKFDDSIGVYGLEGQLEPFLDAIKSAKFLTMSVQTKDQKIEGKISLSGVVASMLFMDESQGREGRTDALHARGDKPAKAVTTRAVALKAQSELPKPVYAIWAGKYAQCSDDEQDIIEKFGGTKIKLDADGSLFLLPCSYPGAYNMPYIAVGFAKTENSAWRREFPTIGTRGPTNMGMAYNLVWNDKKSQLSAFFRGRGIGDCGSKHLWQWEGDSVYGALELHEERVKDDCDEKLDDFPLVWPPD